jgi:hypothetical protein
MVFAWFLTPGAAQAVVADLEPMFVTAARQLDEAHARLTNALALTELSLTKHDDQLDWTRRHMKRTQEILGGSTHSVARLLEDTRDLVAGRAAFPMAARAINSSLDYLHLAAAHVDRSLRAGSSAAAVEHARQAAGLLSAATGRSDTQAPAIGSLSYARDIVKMWTLPVIAHSQPREYTPGDMDAAPSFGR